MIRDCDLRTANLIKMHVQRTLRRMYGSILELELLSIKHDEDRVIVQGTFATDLAYDSKRFAMTLPRVDGSLDYFL